MAIKILNLSDDTQLLIHAMNLATATSLATERHAASLLQASRAPEETLAKARDICQRAGSRARELQDSLDRVAQKVENEKQWLESVRRQPVT